MAATYLDEFLMLDSNCSENFLKKEEGAERRANVLCCFAVSLTLLI